MEIADNPVENQDNKRYTEAGNPVLNAIVEEKEDPLKIERWEAHLLESPDFRNKEIYVGIPILGIGFAEMLIYSGRVKEAIWLHAAILIGLSLSITLMKNEEVYKTYQALLLLPILRMVNISMPVFFDMTLYAFILIYAPLAVPVTIAAAHQHLTRREMGITFKKIWLYLPFSILLGLWLGVGEYLTIQTDYLIPDLSFLNILKLTLVMVFFVGLVEELIFRSMLQTRLNKIFGIWEGILLSSILFGFMHSGYGTPYEVLYTFFVGVFIGYMFYKTQSLPLVTMVHGFVNVFLFGIIPHLAPGLGIL